MSTIRNVGSAPLQLVHPAVPRSVPTSPDQRRSGQARTFRSTAANQAFPFAECALDRPGTVALRPLEWPIGDPEIVGAAQITAGAPGGAGWERIIDVPGWGIAIDVPAGLVVVEGLIEIANRGWWGSVAPGFTTRTWTAHERITTVLGATTVDFDPPRFATMARIAVVSGAVDFPGPGSPLVGGQDRVVPASRVSVVGVAASSEFLVQWEVCS